MKLSEQDHDDLSRGLVPGGPFVDREKCDLCRFVLCHFCGGTQEVAPTTWDTAVGAFTLAMCDECTDRELPPMGCGDAVRLVLSHPADDEGDDQ